MAKATLVFHQKYIDERGGIVEMKAYQVPKSEATPHGFKYSLVYIREGQRLVGYDNHERKGDHRHYRGQTTSYAFSTVDQLIEDFLSDVELEKEI
jgi:uncharacterized protein DUF6516